MAPQELYRASGGTGKIQKSENQSGGGQDYGWSMDTNVHRHRYQPQSRPKHRREPPLSTDTVAGYECYYRVHLKDDPLMDMKMSDIDETDIPQFISRLSCRRNRRTGEKLAGGITFSQVLKFMRMTFGEYQKTHGKWLNPFQGIEAPRVIKKERAALTEEQVIALFEPGILRDPMELAVCAGRRYSRSSPNAWTGTLPKSS